MDYTDIYLTQLFITLGQLSAVLITTTVAVPVVAYYHPTGIINFLAREFSTNNSTTTDNEKTYKDSDIDTNSNIDSDSDIDSIYD